MTVIAAALKHMLASNMPHEAILAAVEDMERGLQTDEQAERRRAADRDRQRQRRLRISADSADKNDSPRASAAHVEDKTSTTGIEPQEQKASRTHGDVDAFRAGLAPDVSEEVLAEFVKVRRKKRGALTGFAAKLFQEDAAKCGMSVAEAAKECVRSSWITVKPEYFQNRQRAGPPGSQPKPPQMADVFKLIKENENGRQEREDRSGTRAAVSYLPAVRSG